MNIVSIIISILLLLLLGTALYKGIFHKNKINNPYSSDFEDMTQGTKPTMDGKNPITQTKEKVQQEIKNENFNEQEITTLEEEHATLSEDFLNEQNTELGVTKETELDHSNFEEEIESTEQWTNKVVPPIAKLPDETPLEENSVVSELPTEEINVNYDELKKVQETPEIAEFETPIELEQSTFEEEVISVEPEEEKWVEKAVMPPPVADLSWGAAAEKGSLKDSPSISPVAKFPSLEDLEAEKNFDKLANEQDLLDERFKEHDDFMKSQVDLSKKNEPGA